MTPDKPSATARLIARSTYFVSRDPRRGHIVPPRAAEMSRWFLEATSSRPGRLLWLIDQRWFRALVALVEAVTIPGILLHYVVRKRYLEDVAREGLAEGIGQVVILGAGFDTLALRLSNDFPMANFIEVDHPATQKIKAQVLQSREVQPANLHLLSVDHGTQNLTTCLQAFPQYQPNTPTLFVAEGLLMYLEPAKVEELFRFVVEKAAPESRFAFTFLEPQLNGKVNFHHRSRLIDFWLNRRQENFRWGLKRRWLESYLTTLGLSLESLTGMTTLRRRYLTMPTVARARLARGEYIGVATVAQMETINPSTPTQ